MLRSYLFVPGHRNVLVDKALRAGADAVIIDLEDAVPAEQKAVARGVAADVSTRASVWVRINAVGTAESAADVDAVAGSAAGIRIPKVEAPEQVAEVARRSPGTPLICAIETAKGLLAAAEIAAVPQCTYLAMGGLDLRQELGVGEGDEPLLYARSHLVAAARAAGSIRQSTRSSLICTTQRHCVPTRFMRKVSASLANRLFRRGSSPSSTKSSHRRQLRSSGHGASWMPSQRLPAKPCAWMMANSSIFRWPDAPP